MENTPKSSNELAQERTNWALSRSRLAGERTMMAVLRTGLSCISFGFTIYKFLQAVHQSEGAASAIHLNGPRNMGLFLIALGTFILALGSWQHWQFLRQLRRETTQKLPWSVPLVGSVILLLVGLLSFITVLARIGPFE